MALTTELQVAALNEVSVSKLVRLALMLATRLKHEDVIKWCQAELNGYSEIASIPSYRVLHGELFANDKWGRTLPCTITDSPQKQQQLMECPFSYTIAEVEDMVLGGSKALQLSFHPEDEQRLRKVFDGTTKVFRIVQVSRCRSILDAVRQRILEWTLALQEQGIDVDGSFEGPKKNVIAGSEAIGGAGQTIQASNVFQIGEISSSPFQVQPAASPQTVTYEKNLDINAISVLIDDLSRTLSSVTSPELEELKSEVETLRQLLAAPKKKHGWIAEGLGSLRKILEEAAGNLAAEGIKAAPYVNQIAELLGLQ